MTKKTKYQMDLYDTYIVIQKKGDIKLTKRAWRFKPGVGENFMLQWVAMRQMRASEEAMQVLFASFYKKMRRRLPRWKKC